MTTSMVREQRITVGDVHLHVAQAGDKSMPTLLLLHGLFDRWESWDSVIRALAPHYGVIAPDLRGHARSSKPESGYAFQDYVDDLIHLLDKLEISEVIPIGHSLGALVATLLAADYPDRVRALVLVDPPFEQDEGTREWLSVLLEAKRGSLEETYQTIREMYWGLDENEWRRQTDWLRATADGPFVALMDMIDQGRTAQLYEVLPRVTCATLLVQADPNSGGSLSDAGAELAVDHIQDCVREKFDDTGHSVHRERPDDFVASVRDFLDITLQWKTP
jgi:pimeloyl-ACP methyl ester carboxylesterase